MIISSYLIVAEISKAVDLLKRLAVLDTDLDKDVMGLNLGSKEPDLDLLLDVADLVADFFVCYKRMLSEDVTKFTRVYLRALNYAARLKMLDYNVNLTGLKSNLSKLIDIFDNNNDLIKKELINYLR